MIITRVSAISGKTNVLDLPVTQDQIDRWQSGVLIQEAFPHLTDSQREFILTGITEEEWDEFFYLEDDGL